MDKRGRPKKLEKAARTTFYMEAHFKSQLCEIAERQNLSMSEIVNGLIGNFVEKNKELITA